MTSESMKEIAREIDTCEDEIENIEVKCDPQTGKFVEFHRNIQEKTA